jgi:hypothetical protein
MKRAIFLLLAVAFVAGLTGCMKQYGRRPWACLGGSCAQAPENAQSCDGSCGPSCDNACEEQPCEGRVCRLRCKRHAMEQSGYAAEQLGAEEAAAPAGPATGAVTYPYYTTRGPRDFLAKNPPSIGP